MNELKELIGILTRQKVSQIRIISEDAKLPTKINNLLNGIRSGTIRSDTQAMDILYGYQNTEAYKKVKYRLKERLYNTLFFIDIKKHRIGKGPQERYTAYKRFSQIMLIISDGHRVLAISMAKKLLRKAEKYEMRELTLLLYDLLVEHYLVWDLDSKKANYYEAKWIKLNAFRTLEKDITKVWAYLANILMVNRGDKSDIDINQVEKKLIFFSKQSAINSSYQFTYKFYISKIFYYWIVKNYKQQKIICIEAINFLEDYKQSHPASYILTTTYKAIAQLNNNEIEESQKTLENIFVQFPLTPGKLHWLNVYNYLFLIKMIKKEYTQAAKLISEVTHLRNFKKLNEKWHQPWLIKEAYINILLKIGKIKEEDLGQIRLRPFRINKFVNEVPLYFKDKRGTNIAILIAQFIFLLADNKTDRLFEKLDGLNQYCHRYLRNDATFRSNCFIKMLMKIPNASFHPVRVRNHTKDYWKKLKAAPMTISEQSYEVEIIPYEDLWELVLEILEDKKG